MLVTKWFGPIASLYQHLKFIWLFIYESRLWAKFSPTSSSPTICSMSYCMYYTIPSILLTHVVVWHTTLPSCMHAFIHTKFSVPMEFNSAKHDFGFWHQYYLCLFSNTKLGILVLIPELMILSLVYWLLRRELSDIEFVFLVWIVRSFLNDVPMGVTFWSFIFCANDYLHKSNWPFFWSW